MTLEQLIKFLSKIRSNYLQKETYTNVEVEKIVDDLKKSFVEQAQPEIEKLYADIKTENTNESQLAKKEVEILKNKLVELNSQIETSTKEKVELEAKLDSAQKQLIPLTEEKNKKFAVDILKGKVLDGAEADVYNFLKKELEENKIAERTTLQEQQKLVEPFLKKFLDSKPYFKPLNNLQKDKNVDNINTQQIDETVNKKQSQKIIDDNFFEKEVNDGIGESIIKGGIST